MEKDKIVFLGSGGGRKITASQMRATGGFVVQLNNEQIHFDPGPGAIVRACQFGIDVKNTSIVLVSHFHIDHCNDVNIIIDAITFGGKDKKGVLISSFKSRDDNLTDFHSRAVEDHVKLKPGDKTHVRGVMIEATKTKGHSSDNIGYKVSTPKLILGYTSDTSFFPELVKEFKGCDVLIVNTLKPKSMVLEGHMNSDDVVSLVRGVKPKLAVLQHFGKSMIEADPDKEASMVEKQSGVKTLAASDSLVLDISQYSKS